MFIYEVGLGINSLGASCNETPLLQQVSCITAISTIITIIATIIVSVTITLVSEYDYHNHYYQCHGSEILEGIGCPPPSLGRVDFEKFSKVANGHSGFSVCYTN